MYRIKVDGNVIYDPRISEKSITSGKLTMAANSAGSFEFSMYSSNAAYGSIQRMKSVIQVFDDDAELFRGRCVSVSDDMFLRRTFRCEGAYAYMNDSVMRPYSYSGSVRGYVEKLINAHNENMDSFKKFELGNITVTDPNDYIVRSNEEYVSVIQEMNDKLVNNLGGYIVIRYDGTTQKIDYLADFKTQSTQGIRVGQNVLDLGILDDATEIATAIIPLGAKNETTGERLTIKSVNNNKDYIFDQTAANTFGMIFKTVIHDDITNASNLLARGQSDLAANYLENKTVSVTAADLSKAGYDVSSFKFGEYVNVKSAKHGIGQLMLVNSLTIDLLDATQGHLTLGGESKSFAAHIISGIISEGNARKEAVDKLTTLIGEKTAIHISKEYNDQGEIVAYYMSDSENVSESTFIVKITMQAMGFSTDGGITYPFGVTIDGDVVANILTAIGVNASWINAGTMTADHIAGGEMVIGGSGTSKDGKISVKSSSDSTSVTLDKNGINAIAGQIGSWKITDGYLQGSFDAVIPPDTDDLLSLIAYTKGEGTLTDDQKSWMDFNGDGNVTASDGLLLKRYLHGIIENPYTDGRTIPTATINVRLNPSSRDHIVYMFAHSVYKGGATTSKNMTQRIGLLSANISRFSGTVKFDKSVYMDNNRYVYGSTTSDTAEDIPLIGLTSADNLAIGSSYDSFVGNVNVYTGQVTATHDPIVTFRFDQGETEKALQIRGYKESNSLVGVWVRPPAHASGKSYLGGSDYRWTTIYSVNALNTSSDVRLKNHDLYLSDDIHNLIGFYKDLKPARYYRKGEDAAEFGLYAQDVEEALEQNDIAGTKIVEEGEDGMLSLYYDSIHNMTIGIVQNLLERIEALEKEIAGLKK